MSIQADLVVATSPIELGIDPDVGVAFPALAHGRALVIDYFAARLGGPTVGDMTVDFRPAVSSLGTLRSNLWLGNE